MKNTILLLFTAFIFLMGFFGMSADALADPKADPLAGPFPDADPDPINMKAVAAVAKKPLG
uniref:Mastoparan-VB2 n=1 Tax=Vespa bicolor TaxID=619325 RepID=MAST2_VESBI|nr:RecName: Full=Mastoparan-VB2; Short=MP-VB2; Flags: Precursor [Vespa bicolor]